MIWLSICFAARVAFVTAYLVVAVTEPQARDRLVVPFGLVVLAVAIYDLVGLLRRGHS